MAFGRRLRHIGLAKQALAAEAETLRQGASLELLAWRRRLSGLGSALDLIAPLLALIGLLRR